MHYRIEISQTHRGVARLEFPGRVVELEATRRVGPVWLVGILDAAGAGEGSVTVRAANAGDAVWRVAQATVRAVAQLTDIPGDDASKPSPDDNLSKLQ